MEVFTSSFHDALIALQLEERFAATLRFRKTQKPLGGAFHAGSALSSSTNRTANCRDNPHMPGSIIDSARHGLSHFNRFSRNLVAPPLSPVIPMGFMIFVVVDGLDRLPADLTPTRNTVCTLA